MNSASSIQFQQQFSVRYQSIEIASLRPARLARPPHLLGWRAGLARMAGVVAGRSQWPANVSYCHCEERERRSNLLLNFTENCWDI